MNYFLVGIKGTGMSALAMLLKDLGNNVVGSDENKEYFTDLLLKEKSIKWHPFGSNLNNDYIYIISNAYDQTNIDVKSIIDKKFEYYYYHDFIGQKLKKVTDRAQTEKIVQDHMDEIIEIKNKDVVAD